MPERPMSWESVAEPERVTPAVAAARVKVKRMLRRRGVAVDPKATTQQLIATARATKGR